MELIDIDELAIIARYSRRRLTELARRDATFPEPIPTLGRKKLFPRQAALDWVRTLHPEDYVTREEFAEIARCSVRTIDRLCQRRPRAFPAEYHPPVGRRRLFKRTEILEFLGSYPVVLRQV